jgi:hypothetical protein
MKRFVAIAVLACVLVPGVLVALDSKKAMFVGGTITTKLKEGTEGKLDTSSDTVLKFIPDKGKGEPAELPYAQVASIEYGQKASHRIKTALLLSPWTLFSKKRCHYYSLMWKDDAGKDQGIVLEVGKDLVRSIGIVLEARTGKKIEFQDDEAKKNFAR